MLASLETRERVAVAGERILGHEPEMIRFSPDGRHLTAYADGLLHLFELGAAKTHSEDVDQGEAAGRDGP